MQSILLNGFDITQFCGKHNVYDFLSPFNDEEYVYACNGHVLLRLKRDLLPEFNNSKSDGRYPEVDKLFALRNDARRRYSEYVPITLADIGKKVSRMKDMNFEQKDFISVEIFNAHASYRYLLLIWNAMQAFGGDWSASYCKNELAPIFFAFDGGDISLMPARIKARAA